MSGYIKAVREHVVNLVEKLFTSSPDLRMKIIAFGDYCDMSSQGTFGVAYQVIELTNDKKALIDFVKHSQNSGGGDSDEFYELVMRKINTETKWRADAAKAVLLIGDCNPHAVGYEYNKTGVKIKNDIDWRQEAQTAKDMGIQYDTLMIDPSVKFYQEISEVTGGVALPFKNAAKLNDVIEGTVFARSSHTSYAKSYASAMTSGDSELIGAFKTMTSSLNIDLD